MPQCQPTPTAGISTVQRCVSGVKVLLASFISLYLAIALGVAVLPHLVDVRSRTEEYLSSALGREVSVSRVRFSLAGGPSARLYGLRVEDNSGLQPEMAPLAEADSVRMKFDLGSMLWGRLSIREVIMENPIVRLVRDSDGRLNVQGEGDAETRDPGEVADAEVAAPPMNTAKDVGARGVKQFLHELGNMGLARITIMGGILDLIDLSGEEPIRERIQGLSVQLEEASPRFPSHYR